MIHGQIFIDESLLSVTKMKLVKSLVLKSEINLSLF